MAEVEQMISVLLVTNMYPTEENPYHGIYVKEIVDVLRARGVDIDVLFIQGKRTPFKYALGVPRLYMRLLRKKYALVHAYYGYSGAVACMQRLRPVVVTMCGSDVNLPSQRPISKLVSRAAAKTVVQTLRMKTLLGNGDAVVFHMGVNLEIVTPLPKAEARTRLGLPLDGHLALFPYDPLRKIKRFSLFESAVKLAGKVEPNLKPLIVKEAPKHDMPLYMSAADVLVMTSEMEGSPNTVKEALACGLPVVSVDVGDVKELVEGIEGNWICDAEAESLAEGIAKAVRFGRTEGRRKAAEMSSEVVAQKIIDIYKEVLSGVRPQNGGLKLKT